MIKILISNNKNSIRVKPKTHDRNTSNGAEVKFDVVPVYLLHTVVLRRVQSFSDI